MSGDVRGDLWERTSGWKKDLRRETNTEWNGLRKVARESSAFFQQAAEYFPVGDEDGRDIRWKAVMYTVIAQDAEQQELVKAYTEQARHAGVDPAWAKELNEASIQFGLLVAKL